jgi:hypothetical protein
MLPVIYSPFSLCFVILVHSRFLHNRMTRRALSGVDGVYVINLARRPDRLQAFKSSSGLRDNEFHRFDAIDGSTLVWNPELQRLFGHNDFNSRAAVVACTLSHYTIWQHIAETSDELHLVFEDDATFVDGWIQLWNSEYAPHLPANR